MWNTSMCVCGLCYVNETMSNSHINSHIHSTALGAHVTHAHGCNSIQYNCSAMKSTFMMLRVFSVSFLLLCYYMF